LYQTVAINWFSELRELDVELELLCR